MGDSITECSTLRSRVSQLETTIEKLRVELEDAHERNRLVGDYNRELLLKLAALDALDTAPTTTFVVCDTLSMTTVCCFGISSVY